MSLSRRTWLWTSTAALAAACARSGPRLATLPSGGQPEGPRPLTRRGAENLIALAELGAAIRWLHPSDQASATAWEPLLLDGVRGLEGAQRRLELVEGLRGLFGGVAPTVVIWRAEVASREDEAARDALACAEPEPDASQGAAAKRPAAAQASSEPDSKPPASPAEATPEPAEPEPAEPEPEPAEPEPDTASGEATPETKPTEPEPAPAPEPEPEPETAEPGEATPETKPPQNKPEPEPEPDDDDRALEPAPELPAALFADPEDPSLTITQWLRRGYSDGDPSDPGCAARIQRRPGLGDAAPEPSRRRREPREPAGPRCTTAELDAPPPAPAAPVRVTLPRGLASLVPLGLWTADLTSPVAPAFDEAEARRYSLDDRGTRLLVVLRAWSLLQRFFPHAPSDPDRARALLFPALCAAAEDPSPVALRGSLEALLAGFGDGNAAILIGDDRASRRWAPALELAWIEERVVVARSGVDSARRGDVVTAVDGRSIDAVVAEQLRRTPAASASAAIQRAVAGLLQRDDRGRALALELLRSDEAGERAVTLTARADRRAEDPLGPADARPDQPVVELDRGRVYVDATRIAKPGLVARRLRRAAQIILDLRGELPERGHSWLAWLTAEAGPIAIERVPTGPTPDGRMPLEVLGERTIAPVRRPSTAAVAVLADARTRGRAELELLGFAQRGATVLGSASAGDLGGVATAWLPGGWRLRFTHSELRRPDGAAVHGVGVAPSRHVAQDRASLSAGEDPLLAVAATLDLRR